jgi:hypothetical protein
VTKRGAAGSSRLVNRVECEWPRLYPDKNPFAAQLDTQRNKPPKASAAAKIGHAEIATSMAKSSSSMMNSNFFSLAK